MRHSVGDEQRTDTNGRELGRLTGMFHWSVRRSAQTLSARLPYFGRSHSEAEAKRNKDPFVVQNQPMVIGLTGASGFLGQEIIRQAVSQGEQVVAYSRWPENQFRVHGPRLDEIGSYRVEFRGLGGWWKLCRMLRIRHAR